MQVLDTDLILPVKQSIEQGEADRLGLGPADNRAEKAGLPFR
jgi:hypothetical protein